MCALKEGKVEQLFRKTPPDGIPCKACVSFGRKGRVPPENGGKCLKHWADLSPCISVSDQDVLHRLLWHQILFSFSMSGRKKRHVLSQMFHWRAHHRQKWSCLQGSRMELEQVTHPLPSLSSGLVLITDVSLYEPENSPVSYSHQRGWRNLLVTYSMN